MIAAYDWPGGREAMLRFGPDGGPVAILAMPLFGEANRLRAFAVTLCRHLATHGISTAIPDLPGQGESLLPTEDARLEHWRTAFAAAAASLGAPVHGISLRSGAVIDVDAVLASRWRLSPIPGATVLSELRRTTNAGARTRGDTISFQISDVGDEPMLLAGNRIAFPLFGALADDDAVAQTAGIPLRTLRLTSDRQDADRKLDAPPLWRRSEPGNDVAFAATLAEDIAAWISRCAG